MAYTPLSGGTGASGAYQNGDNWSPDIANECRDNFADHETRLLAQEAETPASVIRRGTRAAQPEATAVTTGTLYYVTDENVTERSNGTTWDDYSDVSAGGGTDPISSLYPVFTPTGDDDEFDDESFSGWTEVNSGSHLPTLTETNNVLSIKHPGSDAAAELHAWVKARTVNAGDWVETAYRCAGISQNYNIFGVMFADGATYGSGSQVGIELSPTENAYFLRLHTGYNANGGGSPVVVLPPLGSGLVFLRLKYNGANSFTALISPDGISYVPILTSTITLTPTHAGFFCTTWGGTNPFVWSLAYVRFGNG
jgi:hypothetical protein